MKILNAIVVVNNSVVKLDDSSSFLKQAIFLDQGLVNIRLHLDLQWWKLFLVAVNLESPFHLRSKQAFAELVVWAKDLKQQLMEQSVSQTLCVLSVKKMRKRMEKEGGGSSQSKKELKKLLGTNNGRNESESKQKDDNDADDDDARCDHRALINSEKMSFQIVHYLKQQNAQKNLPRTYEIGNLKVRDIFLPITSACVSMEAAISYGQ
nr:hypothetical protein [Tanacetum cinerariifolium]